MSGPVQNRLRMNHLSSHCPCGDKHTSLLSNQDTSATRFCRQVAAQDPDMFCNFNLVKSHRIANSSATTYCKQSSKVKQLCVLRHLLSINDNSKYKQLSYLYETERRGMRARCWRD
jgi:hypothetical protein